MHLWFYNFNLLVLFWNVLLRVCSFSVQISIRWRSILVNMVLNDDGNIAVFLCLLRWCCVSSTRSFCPRRVRCTHVDTDRAGDSDMVMNRRIWLDTLVWVNAYISASAVFLRLGVHVHIKGSPDGGGAFVPSLLSDRSGPRSHCCSDRGGVRLHLWAQHPPSAGPGTSSCFQPSSQTGRSAWIYPWHMVSQN